MSLIQFWACHCYDVVLINPPLLMFLGKFAYYQSVVFVAAVHRRFSANFLTVTLRGPYTSCRVYTVVAFAMYVMLHIALGYHTHYLVEPARKFNKSQVIKREVLQQKLKCDAGSIFPNVEEGFRRNAEYIQLSNNWIKDDAQTQTELGWAIWLAGKILAACLGRLLLKD